MFCEYFYRHELELRVFQVHLLEMLSILLTGAFGD